MKNYIAIVSHGHEKIIINNKKLLSLVDYFTIIIKDNKPSKELKEFCKKNRIIYLTTVNQLGFGENNNYIFNYCINDLDMKEDDYFIVCNPDIYIDKLTFDKIVQVENLKNYDLFTINLYNDNNFKQYDMNIRKFPTCWNFISSFIFSKSYAYEKDKFADDITIDWCTGAFIVLKVKIYKKLKGFDESYFMYVEDLDLCRRAKNMQIELKFIPSIKAQHIFLRESKNLFSKNFYWHVRSVIKYCLKY